MHIISQSLKVFLYGFLVVGVGSVGEVEPGHVHPRPQKPFEHLHGPRRGAQGAHDLGLRPHSARSLLHHSKTKLNRWNPRIEESKKRRKAEQRSGGEESRSIGECGECGRSSKQAVAVAPARFIHAGSAVHFSCGEE
ncbi:hypothetical protein GW17_00022886 [Ensete ventricosum]|nr:hypothetical protein GW17_00022886 [Ensete ventricosum]